MGFIGKLLDPLGLFKTEKPPAAAAPPAAPTAADPSIAAAQDEERRKRAGSGRASTVLSGALGDTAAAPTAKKVLLGS